MNPVSGEFLIEIVYASPQRSVRKSLALPAGSCIADALAAASHDIEFAGIDLMGAAVGVFGVRAVPQQRLAPGDRIEILRPLAADPKNARRERVKLARRSAGQ